MIFLKQSAAAYIPLGPAVSSTDGKTRMTALSIAQADVLLSKNAGTMAAKSDASACSHLSAGNYRCRLGASDVNTVGMLLVDPVKSSALPFWKEIMVLPQQVYDSLIGGTDVIQVDLTQVVGLAQTAVSLAGIKSDTSAIAAAATEARLAELDAANLPADIDLLKVDTSAIADLAAAILADTSAINAAATEARLAELDAGNLPTDVSHVHVHLSALAAIATELRLAELDAANLPTDISHVHADVSALAAKATAIFADTSAIAAKLPSKNYLTGTGNADGDIQANEMTGNFPGSVGSVSAVSDKTGYNLAATGLDLIDSAAPSTVAVTFPEMVKLTYRRLFKKVTMDSAAITCYADDGVTAITTQAISEGGGTQTQGAAT